MKPTLFDEITQNRHVQMIKSAIPFADAKRQRMLSAFVRIVELQQTMRLFSAQENDLKICEVEEEPSVFHLLNSVKEYCTESELETIDNFLNAYDMLHAYEMMRSEKGSI